MVHNQKGVTIIELLIVLSIIMFLSVFSIVKFDFSLNDKDPFEQFLEVFKKDLFMMQQYTITHQEPMFLLFKKDEHAYIIYTTNGNQSVLIERSYDPKIEFDLTSFNQPFRFQPSGFPVNPGAFMVSYLDKHYQFVFPFGKGRFYVSE